MTLCTTSVWKYFVVIMLVVCVISKIYAQNEIVNYVINGGFEDITRCPDNSSQLDFAEPWRSTLVSVDLFHTCAVIDGFRPPNVIGCVPLPPFNGEAYAGLGMFGFFREKMEARMLEPLPDNIDIYCSMRVFPKPACVPDAGINFCFNNGIEMSFFTEGRSRITILQTDTIITNVESWTHMQGCYRAQGSETFVEIGNNKNDAQTRSECDPVRMIDVGYTFIDEVVVSPFDILPETLYICEDFIDVDLSFYDVPLLWEDGPLSGKRRITETGDYVLLGELPDCFLTEPVTVIKISNEKQIFEREICPGQELELFVDLPVPVKWENGERGNFRMVSTPGTYVASLISECGENQWEFQVRNSECNVEAMVANVFSPNGDGINDAIEWTFQSPVPFDGTLYIYDRLGNQVFTFQTNEKAEWNGKVDDQHLAPQVFVWVYKYRSNLDAKLRAVTGDLTLIR